MERLKNGAYVIARRPMAGEERHQIVLALSSGSQPYVTWAEYHHPGEPPATESGHYFDNILEAAQDFEKR